MEGEQVGVVEGGGGGGKSGEAKRKTQKCSRGGGTWEREREIKATVL
jgi:hypothetical protein